MDTSATGTPANSTLELIHRHGSVRRFRGDPVSHASVEQIVAAAQRASSSSNLQAYSVVATTAREPIRQIAALCQQEWIEAAPVFLTWCADLNRLDAVCEERHYRQVTRHVESFLIAAIDAALAAQTAALAAESVGLGICYIGSIRNDAAAMIRVLDLPRLVFPVVGMTVGWPDRPPMIRPRLPLDAVLRWETYGGAGHDRELLLAYDAAMRESGIYNDRHLPSPTGSEVSADEYGWMEHSARRVACAVREDLRDVLAGQGFDLE